MRAIACFDPKVCQGISGTISMEQHQNQIRMHLNLSGLKPHHIYAIHIHEYGDISNGCQSLGKHFDPFKTNLHSHSQQGHAGDLFNNFKASTTGKFIHVFVTDKVSLMHQDPHCILGRSFVIHKFMDDLGLLGSIDPDSKHISYYRDMSSKELVSLCKLLGYSDVLHRSREEMIQKLETESKTTGNAATRIAFALIGIQEPLSSPPQFPTPTAPDVSHSGNR